MGHSVAAGVDGDEEALSVHIYGFDHMMHSTSIHREYEVVAP
jgi:hypothetical protein